MKSFFVHYILGLKKLCKFFSSLFLVILQRKNISQYVSHENATKNNFTIFLTVRLVKKERKKNASAGNRTRINCLEGSYADHYTTDAGIARMPVKPSQLKGHKATTTSVVHISTAKQ